MSDCSLCLLNLRKTTRAYQQAGAMKVLLVHCQVLVQLEGKVKVCLSFEEVLTWEDAFASMAGKFAAVAPQQEMIVLAPTWDHEMKLKEKTGGHQEAWNVMLLKE